MPILARVDQISASVIASMFHSPRSCDYAPLISPAALLLLCLGYGPLTWAIDGTEPITTVAGGGNGDGGPATAAGLTVSDVAVDSAGNLYVADADNHRIRKVNLAGIITTVAGDGTSDFSGDGGPAGTAGLGGARSLTVDATGNLFISDFSETSRHDGPPISFNNRIRKVSPAGIITTVAGNGAPGFEGEGGDGGLATLARINSASGMVVDRAGNLYIADTNNDRIRKVDSFGIITTVVGSGDGGFSGDGGPAAAAGLSRPKGMAVNGDGTLYFADSVNHRIRKVSPAGIIDTVAGNGADGYSGDGGPATAAGLNLPEDVALDSAGNLYIADTGNGRIRKVNPAGIISTVAGDGTRFFSGDGGPATEAGLTAFGVAADSAGNLYVAAGDRVRKVDSAGIITTVVGNGTPGLSGDGGLATKAGLYFPQDVAVDGTGNLYIADTGNSCVRRVDPAGIISTVAGKGSAGISGDGGPAIDGALYSPSGVTVDGAGNLYIADADNHRIRKIDSAGIITSVAGNGTFDFSGDGGPATAAGLKHPRSVAVDSDGNLYIADSGNSRIRKVNSTGIISTVAGNGAPDFSGDGGPAIAAGLTVDDVVVDGAGNLYIADTGNRRIRKVDSAGIISTVAGNGASGSGGFTGDGGPATAAALSVASMAVDNAGNLYLSEYQAEPFAPRTISSSNRIRKVDLAGNISIVARNGVDGVSGFSGDGGPAIAAGLSRPQGFAVDSAGSLYFADSGNDRVRKIAAAITTDLALKITARLKVRAGKTIAYRFVVANKTKVTVPRVVVDGVIGNAAAYRTVPRFCNVTAQNLVCQLGTFNGRKRKAFTVKVKSGTAGILQFRGTVAGHAQESTPANNEAMVATIVK